MTSTIARPFESPVLDLIFCHSPAESSLDFYCVRAMTCPIKRDFRDQCVSLSRGECSFSFSSSCCCYPRFDPHVASLFLASSSYSTHIFVTAAREHVRPRIKSVRRKWRRETKPRNSPLKMKDSTYVAMAGERFKAEEFFLILP